MPLAGSALPHLPAPDLSRLLRHLRPDGSVRAGQRGCSCSDEAPGGEQQGGAAGGDGREEGERGEEGEGGGQPTPQHRIFERRPGAERGHTCSGNVPRCVCISARVEGERAWGVTITMTAVMISCGRWRLRMRSVPMATC